MTQKQYDVAVVGYGPAGLVLAATLGRAGHNVIVFERWPSLYGLPRLTHIDGETARIIQACGDVDHALRDAAPAQVYEWRDGSGELLTTVDWSGESCGFAAHYTMYQPHVEDAIDEGNRSMPNVRIEQGTGVVGIEAGPDGVRLTVRPWRRDRDEQWTAGSQDRVVRASYVVGCDGANSFVRTAMGIEEIDLGVHDRWLNLDTECVRPLGPDFAVSRQFCDPLQPNMFMPIGTKRHRFEVAVRDGDDPAELEDPQWGWRWLRERHGLGPEDVTVLRQIIYTFSARMATTWRHGRVLLAGDAAHTMPPYMGQGACSGMRDGITLGWKLDLVLRGLAGDELLDSYETERRPHVEVIQQCAIALGQVANLKDPVAAAERDAAFRSGNVPPLPPFPHLRSGVVDDAAAGSESPAGTLAPQGVVRRGEVVGRFDDVVGAGFVLVTASDVYPTLSAEDQEFLLRLGMTVATPEPGSARSFDDVDGTYSEYFRTHGVSAFISRPDFHQYWVGGQSDLPAVLRQLRTQLSWVGAEQGVVA